MNKILNLIVSHSLKFWLRCTDIDKGTRNETREAMHVRINVTSRRVRINHCWGSKAVYVFVCVCSLSYPALDEANTRLSQFCERAWKWDIIFESRSGN